MRHGVDLQRFAPSPSDGLRRPFLIGYVGRLTPEKNVRDFVQLERSLIAAGETNFRFLLVGDGSERNWLKQNLRFADLPGVLRDGELTRAFAGMDAFVFPSRTDTFGLVLLEAMASGVPVIVKPEAGVRLGLKDESCALITEDFSGSILRLMRNEALRCRMGAAARDFACANGWSDVFGHLYRTYEQGLRAIQKRGDRSPLS